jgi:hypothetical protein
MKSFGTIKIDIKYKHFLDFTSATFWALEKVVFAYFHVRLLMEQPFFPSLLTVAGFRAFPCQSQILPPAGRRCIFVGVFMIRLSFHATDAKQPFTPVSIAHRFSKSFLPKSLGIASGLE